MQLLPVSDLTWDEDIPTIQLTLKNMKISSGHLAFQKLHGWIPNRQAFVDISIQEKALISDDAWVREHITKMERAFSEQFVRREVTKMRSLGSQVATQPINIGARALIYFPVQKESKLFSNWKGIYLVEDQIDANTFMVYEVGQARKK